jgi:hypothetical protein
MKNEYAAGASKSLKKTTKAIMKFLKDSGDRPQSGLRDFLYDKLGDFAVKCASSPMVHARTQMPCANRKVCVTWR